jgi:hypothetical protein
MPCSPPTMTVRSWRVFLSLILYVSYFLTDTVVIGLTPVGAGIRPPFHHSNIAKFQRSSPKCNDYLGIVVPEQKVKIAVKAINGRCLKCGYRLAWVLVSGKRFNSLEICLKRVQFNLRRKPAPPTRRLPVAFRRKFHFVLRPPA